MDPMDQSEPEPQTAGEVRRAKLREAKEDFQEGLIDEQMYQEIKDIVVEEFRKASGVS